MNLIRKNPANQTSGIRVQTNDDQATIYVYDVIDDWWGIDAESFVREINALDVQTLNVRINSPGGDVFTARAMQTALGQHPAYVVAHIDGLAASAATFLPMAADEVRISDGAFFMIHKGWTFMYGNADELRDQAELLDSIDDSIARDYARRTELDPDTIMDMMTEETWMDGQQAVDYGFAHRLANGITDTEPTIEDKVFDLSAYQHPPEAYHNQQPSPTAVRAHLERRLALIA